MATVQIALCDDETAELDKTEQLLRDYEQSHRSADFRIERFEGSKELLCKIRERQYAPDLIFMDIYMPEETGRTASVGMDAARQLWERKSRAKLVFLTTSREHALDAYDVEAFSYLLKPVQTDKLTALMDRFLREAKEERKQYILLHVEDAMKKVPLHEIVYCEAQGKHQCIYLADGTQVLQNLTMAKLYEMCRPCRCLVKVGASYIVHLEHIEGLNAQSVWMDNGQKIYLPRGGYRSLREQYFDYYCGEE